MNQLLKLMVGLHTNGDGAMASLQTLTAALPGLLGASAAVATVIDNGAGDVVSDVRAEIRPIFAHGFARPAASLTLERHFLPSPLSDPALHQLVQSFDRATIRPFTRSCNQLIDDATWRRSAFFSRACRPESFDQAAYSLSCISNKSSHRPAGPTERIGRCSVIAVFRRATAPPLGRAAVTLLHLAHSHANWFFERLPQVPDMALAKSLSSRQREILRALLAGKSEKQVARDLNRSPHTVHTFVKSIYRAHRVNSRAELLAKYVGRP
jgi:DNA-binding CsgD family transcriptional regulator